MPDLSTNGLQTELVVMERGIPAAFAKPPSGGIIKY